MNVEEGVTADISGILLSLARKKKIKKNVTSLVSRISS